MTHYCPAISGESGRVASKEARQGEGEREMRKSMYTREQKILTRLLRQFRIEKGLTQDQLAERLGAEHTRISNYEHGVRRLDFVELITYLRALDISPLEFLRRFEEAANANKANNAEDATTDGSESTNHVEHVEADFEDSSEDPRG